MATAVSHEQCPQCAKDGHDNSGDNLARYPDGGSYCFRCGYFEPSTEKQSLASLSRGTNREQPQDRGTCTIPPDSSETLPPSAIDWLKKYSLTPLDISKNTILWSEKEQRIVFPYFIGSEFIGWQGRDLTNQKKSKWYGRGNFRDAYYIKGNPYSPCIVIVEDIVSAIRIGNQPNVCAMPLFGSIISTRQLLILKDRYTCIKIWLDKDKETYSRQVSKKAREFGINCNSIVSYLDPKEYTDDNIQSFLYT